MLRREFLRRGSLWVAAGLVTPEVLDRLDWAQHRIHSLGLGFPRARVTLIGMCGETISQHVVPVTHTKEGRYEVSSLTIPIVMDSLVLCAVNLEVGDGRKRHMVQHHWNPLYVRGGNGLTVSFDRLFVSDVDLRPV